MKNRFLCGNFGRAFVHDLLIACAWLCLSASIASPQQPVSRNQQAPVASRGSATETIYSTMTAEDERYRIGSGDVIEVLVFNNPQLSRPELRVDGRGMIRMPLLEGEILAACKTESDLAKDLASRYEEYQKYPQVDVYVKQFNSQPVAIVGAVNVPGRFQLQRRIRLLELLTFAGGPSPTAGRTVQIVHGAGAPLLCDDEGALTKPKTGDEAKDALAFYALNDTLRGAETANPFVVPGDVVSVPAAEQVFVVGNVAKPAAIPLKDTLTVAQAIVMAGGVLPNTEQKNVRIIRQATANGHKTEMMVDLKAINNGKAQDVILEANDVVDVPGESGVKSVLRGLVRAIVPTMVSLPTRVVY